MCHEKQKGKSIELTTTTPIDPSKPTGVEKLHPPHRVRQACPGMTRLGRLRTRGVECGGLNSGRVTRGVDDGRRGCGAAGRHGLAREAFWGVGVRVQRVT